MSGELRMLSEMGVRSIIGGGGGDGFAAEDLENDIGLLLREQRRLEAIDRERDLSIFRSGSAPPSVERALTATGGVLGREVESNVAGLMESNNGNGFLSEEEFRSSPSYLSYYQAHVNLNPPLPPPVLSKEDWRSTQRIHTGASAWGGIDDRRKVSRVEEDDNQSLFSLQLGFNSQEEHMMEPRKAPGFTREWLDEGNGLMGLSLGRQKSFADVLQDDLGLRAPVMKHPSCPSNHNTFVNDSQQSSAFSQHTVNNEVASLGGHQHGEYDQSFKGTQNAGSSSSLSFAYVVGSSHMGNSISDAQHIARTHSPSLPPIGAKSNTIDNKANNSPSFFDGVLSDTVESDELTSAMSGINLSTGSTEQSKFQPGFGEHQNSLFALQSVLNNDKAHLVSRISDPEYLHTSSFPLSMKLPYSDSARSSARKVKFQSSGSKLNGPLESQRFNMTSANTHLKGSPSIGSLGGSPHYHKTDNSDMTFTNYGQNSYSMNPAPTSVMGNPIGTGTLPLFFEGAAAAPARSSFGINSMGLEGDLFAPPSLPGTADLKTFSRLSNQAAAATLPSPLNDPLYIQYLKTVKYTMQVADTFGDPSVDMGYVGNSYSDLSEIQKTCFGSLLQSQKQSDMKLLGKSRSLGHGYYSAPGIGMSYQGSPLGGSISSPMGPGSPLKHGAHNMHFSPNSRNLNRGILDSLHSKQISTVDELFPSTLLEEFKSNKTRCSELVDIASHVVEFSADQYGSRFIQQKLETATVEEINMVFDEIMPHALTLMTDVFGNYVIQKFFEHGSAFQRRELADRLHGHVLTLSLQMYGCRVIQKAIEVVDFDKKTKLVLELDGHVMRCVRDQNGNHVIQKCIECVPQEAIQFIITTFYDKVVTLSTHPYGCRVIQRVLEHCDDPRTQQIVMDEILQSVCVLAQDQYGNYVVQHVLEHGKPHERSTIIKTLAGQIVQMSQQKFASNVVEKCLTFGGLEERQILISEILGSTDENKPLQAMMKDQFANYVVQKVLETCDDQQRELILLRIKVHLNALKKYTYGKHIVARVEKLVAAGEKSMGLHS